MRVAHLPLLLLAALGLAAHAQADVAPMPLERMALRSEAVFIGVARRVVSVAVQYRPDTGEPDDRRSPARIAELVVERWIAGERTQRRYWVWADGTWSSDVTGVRAGERCLWFLEPAPLEEWLTTGSRISVAQHAGGSPIYRVAHSGRGQMRMRRVGGAPHLEIWEGDVWLPNEIPTIPDLDPRYDARRLVRLSHVLSLLHSEPSGAAQRLGTPAEVATALAASARHYPWTEEWESALGVLKRPWHEAMLRVLEQPGHPMRETAAEIASDEASVEALAALGGEAASTQRRRGCLFALERHARWDAILELPPDRLAAALRSEDPETRWRAVRVATKTLDTHVHVLRALADPSASVRWHACRLLRPMNEPSVHVFGEAEHAAVERALLKLVRDDELRVRRAAWEALRAYASDASVEATRWARASPDRVVRQAAVVALRNVPGVRVTRLLVRWARSRDSVLRRAATHALGLEGRKGVEAPLLRSVRDRDPIVRACAAEALRDAEIRTPQALSALQRAAATDPDERVRYAARWAHHDLTED